MPINSPPISPQTKTTTSSRIGLTLVGLFFVAVGLPFTVLIFSSFKSAYAQRSWPAIDCVITRSHIIDNQIPSNPNYRLDIEFAYSVASQPFTATQFRTDYTGSDDYYDAEKLHDAYPVGSHTTGWYDPHYPHTAVLQRSSLLFGLVGLFPLAIVAFGVSVLYYTWFTDRLDRPRNLDRAKRKPGKIFFAIFFLVGSSALIFFFIPLMLRGWKARSWPQVPCTISHSGIGSHSGNKGGTTYSIEVLYRYQFESKNYASSKYGFMTGSSSDYYGKQDVVRSLPPHKKTVCYVDPTDPAYAVLDRSYVSVLLFALIPLVFVIIGAAGLLAAFRTKPATATFARTATPTLPASIIDGSMIGDPSLSGDANSAGDGNTIGYLGAPQRPQTPATALMVAACFALFWNGIVSLFLNQLIVEWKHGQHDYFLAVFLVPFVFVGLCFIGYLGYCIKRCF